MISELIKDIRFLWYLYWAIIAILIAGGLVIHSRLDYLSDAVEEVRVKRTNYYQKVRVEDIDVCGLVMDDLTQ